jgi:hypothetical protein
MRRFQLYRRQNGIWYCQFFRQDSKTRLSGISTGKKNRDEALLEVYRWEQEGISQRKQKQIKNKPFRPATTVLSIAQVLQELKLVELNFQDIPKIEKILRDKGLVTAIIQPEIRAAEIFTDYLIRFWDYETSPYVEEKLSHKIKIGRSHTSKCLQRVKRYWNPYFRGKFLGDHLGRCQKILDLFSPGKSFAFPAHLQTYEDGLKSTKTDEPRKVPIIPQLRDALIKLGNMNPHGNGFIFFCEKSDRPWDQQGPLLQLKKMLVQMRMGNLANETDQDKRKAAR